MYFFFLDTEVQSDAQRQASTQRSWHELCGPRGPIQLQGPVDLVRLPVDDALQLAWEGVEAQGPLLAVVAAFLVGHHAVHHAVRDVGKAQEGEDPLQLRPGKQSSPIKTKYCTYEQERLLLLFSWQLFAVPGVLHEVLVPHHQQVVVLPTTSRKAPLPRPGVSRPRGHIPGQEPGPVRAAEVLGPGGGNFAADLPVEVTLFHHSSQDRTENQKKKEDQGSMRRGQQ